MLPTPGTAIRQTLSSLTPQSSDSTTHRITDNSSIGSTLVTVSLSSESSDDEIPAINSIKNPVSHDRGNSEEPPVATTCWSHWASLGTVRAGLELVSQVFGQLANAGLIVGQAQASLPPMRCIAGSSLTLASGYCG